MQVIIYITSSCETVLHSLLIGGDFLQKKLKNNELTAKFQLKTGKLLHKFSRLETNFFKSDT